MCLSGIHSSDGLSVNFGRGGHVGTRRTRGEREVHPAPLLSQLPKGLQKATLKSLTDQLHGWSMQLSQEDPISRKTPPSRGNEFEIQKQNPSDYGVKNASLVQNDSQAFPRFNSVQP